LKETASFGIKETGGNDDQQAQQNPDSHYDALLPSGRGVSFAKSTFIMRIMAHHFCFS
jgi:hypothetical protein